ncbi:MAG: substrate-binding domain-containing protein, partial [Lachnoclostridium sp.]|nr:substrate-binding domain-containing protein [Lachnoclostridium sp.]
MVKRLSLILLCLLIATITEGCRERQVSEIPESEQLRDENTLIKIGFSQVGAESDWRNANTASMKEALSEKNGFELIFSDAQQKQENQIKAIRDFIAQEVDIIVIAPIGEEGWDTVLQEVKDAGIPVIIVDRMITVSDESLYTCQIGSNFEKEGIDAATWLVEYVKNQGIAKKRNIV